MIDLSINRAPRLGVFTFDAVLSSKTKGSVKLTKIPLESGAEINDHRIREPNVYVMQGAMSNSPLKQNIDDLMSLGLGAFANFKNNPSRSMQSISSAYLAGSEGLRAPTAASLLITLKDHSEPIMVSTGMMLLKDMVITEISIEQDPKTDNGFIFTAELMEYIYIKSLAGADGIEETPASQMDPSVAEKAAPKSFLGSLGLESIADTQIGQQFDAFLDETFSAATNAVKDAL